VVVRSVTFSTKRNAYLNRNAFWTATQLTKTLKMDAPCFSKTLVFIGFACMAIIVWYQKRMLYSFFWVIPCRLNVMFRRFGTLCSIFIDGVSGKNNRDEIDGYLYRKRFGSKMPPCSWGFDVTLRHTTLDRTPLDECSASCRDLYLTTHNTRDIHPWPRRDSNPQSQKATGRKPTP
jgi:hypothetical protein